MRTKPVTPMLAPEKGAVWSIIHKGQRTAQGDKVISEKGLVPEQCPEGLLVKLEPNFTFRPQVQMSGSGHLESKKSNYMP